jgi:hypothetical protein
MGRKLLRYPMQRGICCGSDQSRPMALLAARLVYMQAREFSDAKCNLVACTREILDLKFSMFRLEKLSCVVLNEMEHHHRDLTTSCLPC